MRIAKGYLGETNKLNGLSHGNLELLETVIKIILRSLFLIPFGDHLNKDLKSNCLCVCLLYSHGLFKHLHGGN